MYEGAKTRARVDSELSEEFKIKVGMHQRSVLSPFLLTAVVDIYSENVKGILEAVEQEVTLCDEVETVSKFTYLGDRVSACGGCETAVTDRTRCWWIKFRECGELLYGRFPLKLK